MTQAEEALWELEVIEDSVAVVDDRAQDKRGGVEGAEGDEDESVQRERDDEEITQILLDICHDRGLEGESAVHADDCRAWRHRCRC